MQTNLPNRHAFPRRGIYAITPDQNLASGALLERTAAALQRGVRVVQYRRKAPPDAEGLTQLLALRDLCHQFGAPLIINDDIELAYTVGADGVHLGKDDHDFHALAGDPARQLIVGVSCYDSLPRAREAVAAGVDYIAFGRFYSSLTKPAATPCSLDVLRRARAEFALPIVAIGGITPDNGSALLAAGAALLATVEGIFGQRDCGEAARRFQSLFQQ